MNSIRSILALFLLTFFSLNSYAGQRIAILDIELSDMTFLPNTAQELQRTASIQSLLEQALNLKGEYEIIHIAPQAQQKANAGVGYLFRFDDLVAKLGEQYAADWVVVGRHSKPSFLYSHLMLHLIQTSSQVSVAAFDVELKGTHEKVTQRAVNKLADNIHKRIKKLLGR